MDDLLAPRLVLHPLTASEAERIVAGAPGPGDRWAPGYPGDGDATGARLYLENCAVSGDPSPFGVYEVRRRADGRAVGGIGFHGPPDEAGRVTVGYGLVPTARGNGYASEALRALLAFARASGVPCVRADADPGNVASQRVMTAAGMRLVREDDELRYYEIAWPENGA